MITISNDLGTFSGETMRDAQREFRKAQRAAAAQIKVDSENHERAVLLAKGNAYDIARRMLAGEKMPRGWHVHRVDSQYSPIQSRLNEIGRRVLAISAEFGKAEWRLFSGERVEYGIENGAGWPIAVQFEYDGKIQIMAIGVQSDQFAAVEIPGASLDMFNGADSDVV